MTTNTPTFEWSDVPGAPLYGFTLLDLTTHTKTIPILNLLGTTFSLSVPLANDHLYQWSIAIPGVSAVPSSQFTVSLPGGGTNSLAAPGLSGPSGVENSNTPTFQWSPVQGATGYGLFVYYAINGLVTIISPVAVSGTSYVLPDFTFSTGPYLWWVVAFDDAGDTSAPSTSANFFVATTSVGLATPTAASPSGVITTYTPNFQWSSVSGITGYNFYLIDETANNSLLGLNVFGPSYSLGNPFGASDGQCAHLSVVRDGLHEHAGWHGLKERTFHALVYSECFLEYNYSSGCGRSRIGRDQLDDAISEMTWDFR